MRVLAVPEDGSAKISSGDTAWVLNSSALVFIMVPGLQSFIPLAIVGLLWVCGDTAWLSAPASADLSGTYVSMALSIASFWSALAMTSEPRGYMHRRTREGMSKPEVIRCLKRYVVREIYSALKVSSRMPNFEP